MAYENIIKAIDSELSRLQNIRQMMDETPVELSTPPASKRGRPKGSKNPAKVEAPTPTKRTMSDEARARIGQATRKRHAANKKAAKKAAKAAAQEAASEAETASE